MSDLLVDRVVLEEELLLSVKGRLNVVPEVLGIVSLDDFSVPSFRTLLDVFLRIFEDFGEVEASALRVAECLKSGGFVFDRGLIVRVLTNDSVPVNDPCSIARALHVCAVRDRTVEVLGEYAGTVAGEFDPLPVIDSLRSRLEEFSSSLAPVPVETYEQKLDAIWEKWNSEVDVDDVIPSPYPTLNGFLNGGFHGGQLITIGARPGVGKTVFSTECAVLAGSLGKRVVMFSLEVGMDKIYKRMLASYGNIFMNLIDAQSKSAEARSWQEKKWAELKGFPIVVHDDAEVTIDQIRAVVQKLNEEEPVDMVIIDYLQLITPNRFRGRTRQEEVAEISRSCKVLAKQLGVPVMILVQVNRGSKNDDEDRMPSMEEIKESGAIAADSDVVIILHRKIRDDSAEKKAYFLLDKNRDGSAGKIFTVFAELSKNRFIDAKAERAVDESSVVESQELNESSFDEFLDSGEFEDLFE